MCGALLCGIVYHKTHKLLPTLVGEVFGTSIIGGLLAWPVAILFMGKAAGDIAFYAYIVPFLVSTVGVPYYRASSCLHWKRTAP